MKRSWIIGLTLALITLFTVTVGVLAIGGVRSNTYKQAASQETTLDEATKQELSQRALRFTLEHKVLSGTPQVLLVRDLVLDDLLGLGMCPSAEIDPANDRLAIVVVKADVDWGDVQGQTNKSLEARRFGYLLYILDSTAPGSGPKLEVASRFGGSFRHILHDPSLPDDVPAGAPPGTRQVDKAITLDKCPPIGKEYHTPSGQVEPPVNPTTVVEKQN